MQSSSEHKQVHHSQDAWWLLVFKGVLMGAVEIIPGVSAGTIALITGILPRLIDALRNVNFNALSILRHKGLSAAWKYIDGNFLVLVAIGLLTGFSLLIQVITFALQEYPVFIWSFFFGLILASSVWLAGQISQWSKPVTLFFFISGFFFAYYITVASPIYIPLTPINVFFAGMLAISAMMLPGLSGSFILMLAGMYQSILAALKALDLMVIIPFMLGASIGILAFSHLLSFLFHRFPMQVYACLTGVMLGSLNRIWPWQEVLKTRINSHGEEIAMLTRSVSPAYFEQITGQNSEILFSLAFMLVGAILVFCMTKLEGLLSTETSGIETIHVDNNRT